MEELTSNLVLHINQLETEEEQEENLNDLQPALTYRTQEEAMTRLAEEKKKLAERLSEARKKRQKETQKENISDYIKQPEKLVGQRVKHNCFTEKDSAPVWYAATVLQMTKRRANPLNTLYKIKYDVGDEWEFPLLQDLQIGDLTVEK